MIEASSSGSSSFPSGAATAPPSKAGTVVEAVGHFRWVICALLLFATTKSYMDRQVLSVLKPTLQHSFGWNEIDYGNIVFAFQTCYAIGIVIAGRFVDRLGTRISFAIAMTFWSLASMSYGLAHSLTGFMVAAAALGLGQSGLFPASIKCVAEWFPKKDRSLATGIFNSGTSIGAIITPTIVTLIVVRLALSWHWAFFLVGGLGFLWVILWLALYRHPAQHPWVSKAELAYINSDPPGTASKIPWSRLLPLRQTWAFGLGKLLTDPVWWFYLFWAPDFFQRRFGLTLAQIRWPIAAIYLISDIGSFTGGYISGWFIKRGATINSGRKTAMLICALAVTPVVFASRSNHVWLAVAVIGLAAAAHQGFSANLFTLPSDMFPTRAVGSVVGIGGTAGAIGGMVIAKTVGHVLQRTGSYQIPLIIAGSAYLVALALIQILVPHLEAAPVET
jgi:MFS transporter, ACS family, aldohexuronate transporter